MEDKRKNNGGARPGAGRKPKADELTTIENMNKALAPADAWKALVSRVNEGDVQAIKLWLNYRFGMPKQSMDIKTTDLTSHPTKIIFTDGVITDILKDNKK